jgi:hypothetical protein
MRLVLLQSAIQNRESKIMCRPFGDPDWVADTAKRLGLECTVRPRGRPKKQSGACHVYLYSLCSPDLVAVTFHLPAQPAIIQSQQARRVICCLLLVVHRSTVEAS